MSFNIPSHYRQGHIEYPILEAHKKILEHNSRILTSRIPTGFKEIVTWIPTSPIPYQELAPLYSKIDKKINELISKILPKKSPLVALNLINRSTHRPIHSLVSPLISALNLDPPLCPTPLVNLPKKIDSFSYDALTAPKNFAESKAQDYRLTQRINRISKALDFLVQPLQHPTCFDEPWIQTCSIKIPSETLEFAQYAYHHPIETQPVSSPGSFSVIRAFTLNDASKSNRFIVKCPKETGEQNMFFRESSLLMVLDHPNIIPCVAMDSDGLYFPSGTPWTTYLTTHGATPHQLKNYILQIAKGLNYLHEKGFTHKDVKLDNIVFFKGQACLIDFGFTCKTDNDTWSTGALGYKAPEIFAKRFPYSNKVDSWALGVVFHQTIVGTKTYFIKDSSDSSKEEFLLTHLDKAFPVDYFEKIKDPYQIKSLKYLDPEGHFQKIISRCLHGNPINRLSMQELISELESVYPKDLRSTLV